MAKITHTLDTYTAQFDDAMAPRVELRVGDRYHIPEDPEGTGSTVDGREWDAFSRRMRDAGLRGEYLDTIDGWDVYTLVRED